MKKVLIVLVIIMSFIVGCGQTTNTIPAESNMITINNFAFEPSEITVDKGTEVTWFNNDNAVHTVVSLGLFESGTLNKGSEFKFAFNEPGEYNYNCGIHTSMTGKVIVR